MCKCGIFFRDKINICANGSLKIRRPFHSPFLTLCHILQKQRIAQIILRGFTPFSLQLVDSHTYTEIVLNKVFPISFPVDSPIIEISLPVFSSIFLPKSFIFTFTNVLLFSETSFSITMLCQNFLPVIIFLGLV